ncbi:hypothetical protein BRD04_04365 [Halobacteriales archaeon QS_9_67_17]|nr:MAG: hypothetical protein BRD04_04365 [Halobacteriales archaeon QS_9_67_17]
MQREISRRSVVKGTVTVAIAGLAGCSESDSGGGDETTSSDDSDTATDGGSDGDDSDSSSDAYEYMFTDSDDVVGSSLTGIRANYPDGSGAVSDASLASVMLAGTDISDDFDELSTSNNGSSLRIDFGGSYDVAAGDTLSFELSGIDDPGGSYTVEVVVNPQSGGTTFQADF